MDIIAAFIIAIPIWLVAFEIKRFNDRNKYK